MRWSISESFHFQLQWFSLWLCAVCFQNSNGFVMPRSLSFTRQLPTGWSSAHDDAAKTSFQNSSIEDASATIDSSSSSSGGGGGTSTLDWIEEAFRKLDDGSNPFGKPKEGKAAATTTATPTVVPLLKSNQVIVGPSQVLIYDTSLRDGTQGESVSASCEDKLKIATKLSEFGMDYIEAGWPGSNPKDAAFFDRARTELSESVQQKLVAFGSTRRKHCQAKDDKQIQALVDSNVPTICMVAKAHPGQVTEILRTTLEENLKMIQDSVSYLVKEHGKTVLVDLEHFFDGYKADPNYILECCRTAVQAGASSLVLCDTNGGTMPWEMATICQEVVQEFSNQCTIGIHCHNDCGMAVANSCTAIQNGVGLIQGTMNGIGERTGNADLCSIVPTMALHGTKSQMNCKPNLSKLTPLSRQIDELLNRTPNAAAPFVGSSAFAHKGGLHVAAMERNPFSYQHIDPSWVGNEKRILISELSGRQNIMGKLQENILQNGEEQNDPSGKTISDRAIAILNRVKELEHQGYTFEGAEASVDLMILHSTKGYCSPFSVLDYSAHVYDDNMDSANRIFLKYNEEQHGKKNQETQPATSRATVKVRTVVDDPESMQLKYQDILQVSEGNGPVDALAKALLRALVDAHPYLSDVELVDYKVRILDPTSATGAATRVLIEFKDTKSDKQWTTVSVDRNVISASLNALIDGFEYALIEHAAYCMLCEDAY